MPIFEEYGTLRDWNLSYVYAYIYMHYWAPNSKEGLPCNLHGLCLFGLALWVARTGTGWWLSKPFGLRPVYVSSPPYPTCMNISVRGLERTWAGLQGPALFAIPVITLTEVKFIFMSDICSIFAHCKLLFRCPRCLQMETWIFWINLTKKKKKKNRLVQFCHVLLNSPHVLSTT